jgi:hypothetical protein
MKLRRQHILRQWSEAGSGDGYWITLRAGFKWAGDPRGAVHCIHEPTRAAAHREEVLRCACEDCRQEILQLTRVRA